jgi:hypothetical protein
VFHQRLGGTVEDPRFGSVKVSYNDNPVKTLFFSTVSLSNDSGRDLTDLALNIVSDPGSIVLVSHGKNQSSLNDLTYTNDFATALTTAEKSKTWIGVANRRDYHIAVLNRGDDIQVSLLITNTQGNQPFLTVGCDKPGVKLKYALKKEQFWGEPRDESGLLGLVVVLGFCWGIVILIPNKTLAVYVAAVLGGICLIPGVGVRKLVRAFVRMLS